MHTTGIYTWSYLRHLAENRDEVWRTYLDALEDRGLSRGPLADSGPIRLPAWRRCAGR